MKCSHCGRDDEDTAMHNRIIEKFLYVVACVILTVVVLKSLDSAQPPPQQQARTNDNK